MISLEGVKHHLREDREGETFVEYMVAHGDHMNLCEDFDEDGAPTPHGIERAERFVARAKNWTPVAWGLYHRVGRARAAGRALVCEVVGHDLVDTSYGGPDSGCMSATCNRCGWGFHHQLY